MGQLKSTLYARLEEVSFRAGAVVAGGVLTTAGVAITLAVVLGGHSDAVASASASRTTAPSLAPPVAPVSSAPSPTPRPSRTATRATAAGTHQPPSATRASATRASAARASAARQAAATSALGRTPTRRLREARSPWRPGMLPGYWRSRRPRPWLYSLPWHRHR